MKKCTNPNCGHELYDSQNICPFCGVYQKNSVNNSYSEMSAKDDTNYEPKLRHSFTSFWIILTLVLNSISSIVSFFPKYFWGAYFPDEYVTISIISGIIGLVYICSITAILMWKKIGFYALIIACIANTVISLTSNSKLLSSNPIITILGFVGLIIFYAILQLKSPNGKSCWEQLD